MATAMPSPWWPRFPPPRSTSTGPSGAGRWPAEWRRRATRPSSGRPTRTSSGRWRSRARDRPRPSCGATTIFVLTAAPTDKLAPEGTAAGGGRSGRGRPSRPASNLQPDFVQQFIVIAINRKDGQKLWRKDRPRGAAARRLEPECHGQLRLELRGHRRRDGLRHTSARAVCMRWT